MAIRDPDRKVKVPSMLLLPPPLSERTYVVAAARRRGISIGLIGPAWGISKQRVDQILTRYEKYHGRVSDGVPRNSARSRFARKVRRCSVCDEVFFETFKKRSSVFCSQKCSGVAQRILTDEEIKWAIDQRSLHNQTWTGLAKILRSDMQVVQKRIWHYLAEHDRLTKNIVDKIWMPAPSLMIKHGRWNWLINSTGLSPKEDAAVKRL